MAEVAARMGKNAEKARKNEHLDEIFDDDAATKRAAFRRELWADQRYAGLILPLRPGAEMGDGAQPSRVALCRWAALAGKVSVSVSKQGRAAYRGLATCGNVWRCPICAQRISQQRRNEMNQLLGWARRIGHTPLLLTITMRHRRGERLHDLLRALRASIRKLRQRRQWRALPLVGTVSATEMTHGDHGWHPHQHLLLIMDAPPEQALEAVEALRALWSQMLRKEGRDCGRAGWDVQDASAAADYVAKGWGPGEEMTLDGIKSGRGRSPGALLRDARHGDEQARALWLEYADATVGTAQLAWSAGLKAAAQIDDVSDADAARDDQTADGWEAFAFDLREWRARRARRVHWLEEGERKWAANQPPPPGDGSRDMTRTDDQQDESPDRAGSQDAASAAAGTSLHERPDTSDADEPPPTRHEGGEGRARDWIDAALDAEDEPDMASFPAGPRTFHGMGLWAAGGG